jgi:hypothetical protein
MIILHIMNPLQEQLLMGIPIQGDKIILSGTGTKSNVMIDYNPKGSRPAQPVKK